jgi:ABC-2 type transport system permease protein
VRLGIGKVANIPGFVISGKSRANRRRANIFYVFKKYLVVVKTYWQRALTYRFTILAYRVGEVSEMVILIIMWVAIFGDQETVRGFTLQEMITYILIGNLINAIVRNFLATRLSNDIKRGRMSLFLVKPMSYFVDTFLRGFASLATIMSVGSQLLVMLFFLHLIKFNTDPRYLLVIVAMVFLAYLTEFLLSFLVGLIAFWTDEVDGVYATIDRIKRFIAGSYFPLSLLPAAFVKISFMFPFAYSFFVPTELYLRKINLGIGIRGLAVQLAWIVLLGGITAMVWRLGVKRYEGVGI